MGDFIHSLYAAKNICEGDRADIFLAKRGGTWRYGLENAYADLRAIVLAQPYVNSFQLMPDDFSEEAVDLCLFHSAYAGVKIWSQMLSDVYGFPTPARSKWMDAGGTDERTRGKILINRSPEHHNHAFPWAKIASLRDIVFIASRKNRDEEGEWGEFEFKTGDTSFLFVPTITEMVVAIGSCRLFVGNQSCPFAVACALDVPRLVELDPVTDWSCFYRGEEAYSDNISWFVDEKSKFLSSSLPPEIASVL